MNPLGSQFLKWTLKQYYFRGLKKDQALPLARKFCREQWNRYGGAVIKRVLSPALTPRCGSLDEFKTMCEQHKKYLEMMK